MDATSWFFEAGHSIRVSLAASDFPNSWPTPKLHTGTLYLGGEQASSIKLPVLDAQVPLLPTPQLQPPLPYTPHVSGYSDKPIYSVTRDHIAGTAAVIARAVERPAANAAESADQGDDQDDEKDCT